MNKTNIDNKEKEKEFAIVSNFTIHEKRQYDRLTEMMAILFIRIDH